jgi:hypothetical protein
VKHAWIGPRMFRRLAQESSSSVLPSNVVNNWPKTQRVCPSASGLPA